MTPLPCPFCGNSEVIFVAGSTHRWLVAECNVCGAHCGETRAKTLTEVNDDAAKARATAEWNTRAAK